MLEEHLTFVKMQYHKIVLSDIATWCFRACGMDGRLERRWGKKCLSSGLEGGKDVFLCLWVLLNCVSAVDFLLIGVSHGIQFMRLEQLCVFPALPC